MRLAVIAVGTRLPRWADEAFAEYAKRMPRTLPLVLHEIRPEPRDEGKPVDRLLAAEAARIRSAIPRDSLLVALDERGREFGTAALARWLEGAQNESQNAAFVIGGADGLDPGIRRDATLNLRLSAMTLPHALARVLLAEQLYRAVSILQGHPYHRD